MISTPLSAAGDRRHRLRGGNAASARGAAASARGTAGFAAGAITTARAAGCTGTIVVRMDSAYYAARVIAAIRRAGARFSVTVPMDPKVRAAIAVIPRTPGPPSSISGRSGMTSCAPGSPTPRLPRRNTRRSPSKKGQAVTARLIVRRVRDLNKQAAAGQDELFPVFRYHAVFTDSPFEFLQAEGQHRDHAVVEQVFADWSDGPLAHLPSGSFAANADFRAR